MSVTSQPAGETTTHKPQTLITRTMPTRSRDIEVTMSAAGSGAKRAARCGGTTCGSACLDGAMGLVLGLSVGVYAVLALTAASPTAKLLQSAQLFQVVFVVLGVLFTAAGCCFGHVACGRPHRSCCFGLRPWSGTLIAALLAALLVSIPHPAQQRVMLAGFESAALVASYVLGQSLNPLPFGYCAEMAEAAQSAWLSSRAGTPAAQLAAELVAEMSREELSRLVQGVGWTGYKLGEGYYMGTVLGVPRLGLPSIHMHDAGQGFRTVGGQRVVGTVTSWPCALAAAAAWDASLTSRWATAIGREFKTKGANVIFGPAVDVARVPLNGRAAESMAGEEPTLGAIHGAAFVAAVQAEGVAATAKHFASYWQETNRGLEGGGVQYSSDADERTLFEVYYAPYASMIEAGLASVMCSFNRLNGTNACENGALNGPPSVPAAPF